MSLKSKLSTLIKTAQAVENWPSAIARQISRPKEGQQLLVLRNGLRVYYRTGNEDWATVKELALDSVYEATFAWLQSQTGRATVLDLGANIGLFSLLAARLNANLELHAYEPAPMNLKMIDLNRCANGELAKRIHVHPEAVGGRERTAQFYFDEKAPQASGLFNLDGKPHIVQVASFSNIIEKLHDRVLLVKMDIEGAEYEVLKHTPASTWEKVMAVTMEIHGDPDGCAKKEELVNQMKENGFLCTRERADAANYFFHRQTP